MLRVLDLFSGIGGFSLGLERTGGFRTVAFCENAPFAQRVLAKHWPGVQILEDVTTADFPIADVVVGGFPCQDISCAGKRAGLAGERSGLYRELVRAIRMVRPKHAILENVAALLGNGMGTVLGDLAESGCDAEWDCVPARSLGAPHERDRVFIVAHTDCERRGETRKFQHRPDEAPSGRVAAGVADASDAAREPLGSRGQPRQAGCVGRDIADPESLGCGSGGARRPPDSFARIRDEARRNAADPYGARLAFREGVGRDAWEERQAAERDGDAPRGQSIWPDEPALSGVDDEIPDWVDRVKATGNTLDPLIPELIGRAILAAEIS